MPDVDFARNLGDDRHQPGDDDSGGPMAFARNHWCVVASATEIGGQPLVRTVVSGMKPRAARHALSVDGLLDLSVAAP
ncbi:MAG: hypothetical protein ACRD0R_13555 [Acidimicrobiales bacterium]